MNTFLKIIAAGVLAGLLLTAIPACQKKEGPMEQAGKSVDKAVESAGEQIEKAGEKIQDASKADGK